ncbi:hypothetical protein ACWDAF_32895, partial [Streptomyces sp. NPDC001226]
ATIAPLSVHSLGRGTLSRIPVASQRSWDRKVTGTPGFLVPTGGTTTRQGGRPAQLFRAGGATLLNPPMLRPEV